MALRVIGTINNFVRDSSNSAEGRAHDQGLSFVALDSRCFPHWKGETMTGEWVVHPRLSGCLRNELLPWPELPLYHTEEAQARQVYQSLRNHILSKMPGTQARAEQSPDRMFVDPQAWSEGFYYQGEPLMWLWCDRSSEALRVCDFALPMDRFKPQDGPPVDCLSYKTEVQTAFIAVNPGAQGLADQVLILQGKQPDVAAIEAGAASVTASRQTDVETIQVPSGLLILTWGRVPGGPLFAAAGQADPAMAVHQFLGNQFARAIPTALDARSGGPVAYALRVTPGEYEASEWTLASGAGVKALLLARKGAPALQPFVPPSAASRVIHGFTLERYAELCYKRDAIMADTALDAKKAVGQAAPGLAGAFGGMLAGSAAQSAANGLLGGLTGGRYGVRGVDRLVADQAGHAIQKKGMENNPLWQKICGLCQEYGLQPAYDDGIPSPAGSAHIDEWDQLIRNDPKVHEEFMQELSKIRMRAQGIDPNSLQGQAALAVQRGGAVPQEVLQQEMARAQAAQQQIASGQGGDPDPVVFPGAKVARLSDYVRMMKDMQRGDMNGTLKRAGLSMNDYVQVAQQWGNQMAADPTLSAKFSAMMAKP